MKQRQHSPERTSAAWKRAMVVAALLLLAGPVAAVPFADACDCPRPVADAPHLSFGALAELGGRLQGTAERSAEILAAAGSGALDLLDGFQVAMQGLVSLVQLAALAGLGLASSIAVLAATARNRD